MTTPWILSAAAFALAMTASPGPNNMMLANSGANFGLWRTVPHIIGIAIGIVTVQFAIAAVGTAVLGDPRVRDVLKWAGAAYVVHLAFRTATARKNAPGCGLATPMSFASATIFQWVNPKVWVAAGSAVVTFAGTIESDSSTRIMAVLATIFGLAAIPTSLAWTLIGVAARGILQADRSLKIFNVAMAVLLVMSLAPVLAQ